MKKEEAAKRTKKYDCVYLGNKPNGSILHCTKLDCFCKMAGRMGEEEGCQDFLLKTNLSK